jgi:hypothetical protein
LKEKGSWVRLEPVPLDERAHTRREGGGGEGGGEGGAAQTKDNLLLVRPVWSEEAKARPGTYHDALNMRSGEPVRKAWSDCLRISALVTGSVSDVLSAAAAAATTAGGGGQQR